MSTKKPTKKKSVVKTSTSISSLKRESTTTTSTASNRDPEAESLKWSEMKEDLENDNYIYGLHEEIVNKALLEIKEEKLRQKRVDDFVESFCRAWLKLVKWRWMFRDDTRQGEIPDDVEPKPCPRDSWATFTYKESMTDTPRTTVPPPKKCCPHPDFKNVETINVPQPQIERLIRRKVEPTVKVDQVKKISSNVKLNEPQENFRVGGTEIKPTAFPARATGKISQGSITSNSGNKTKPYVTQVVLGQEDDNEDKR